MKIYEFDEQGINLWLRTSIADPGLVLDEGEQQLMIQYMLKGKCSFCSTSIPEEDKLCSRCLDEIATDWTERHQWRSPGEIARHHRDLLDEHRHIFFPGS